MGGRWVTRETLVAMLLLAELVNTGCKGNRGGGRNQGDQDGGDTDSGKNQRRPNLQVQGLTVVVEKDGRILVRGRVINNGLKASRKSTDLMVKRVPEDGDSEILATERIKPIKCGRGRDFEIPLPAGRIKVARNVRIRAEADARNQVLESNEKDNASDHQFDYGPDLVVASVEKDPASDKDGRTVKVKADLRNRGTVSSGPVDVRFQILIRDSDSPQCFMIQKTLRAAMDSYHKICGAHAHDFSKEIPALVEKKILVSYPKDPGSTGNESWKNYQGAGTGLACSVHGTPEKPLLKAPEFSDLDKRTVSLDPGQAASDLNLTVETKPEYQGRSVRIRLVVDPDNSVVETREGNNRGGVDHEFPPASPKPEIKVFGLVASWNNQANDITFHSFIRNDGKADTGAFTSQWARGESNPAGTSVTPISDALNHLSIPAGQIEEYAKNPEFKWNPPAELSGKVVALSYTADVGNQVDEESDVEDPSQPGFKVNGADNTYGWDLKLPDRKVPDLRTANLVSQLTDSGRVVWASGEVANIGNLKSDPFKLLWTVDEKVIATIPLPELPPTGNPTRHVLIFPVSDELRKTGFVTVKLTVIPGGPDRASDNNEAVVVQKVPEKDPIGPDLVVAGVTVELTKSTPDATGPDQLVVTGTIQNSGDEASDPYAYEVGLLGGGPVLEQRSDCGLKAGELRTHTIRYNLRRDDYGKVYIASFRVRPRGTDASDKNNSGISRPIVLPPPPVEEHPLPDLTVSRIRVIRSPGSRVILLRAVVENRSEADANLGFDVSWFVNGKLVKQGYIPKLGRDSVAGCDQYSREVVYLKYEPKADDEAVLKVHVGVDTCDLVPETNEINNWEYREVLVQPVLPYDDTEDVAD